MTQVNAQAGKKLTEDQEEFLGQLGLSTDAVEVYSVLFDGNQYTAADIGGRLGRFSSAQYRLLYQLEHYGLIRRNAGRPRKFVALPVESGFYAALHIRQKELSDLMLGSVPGGSVAPSSLRLVVGREALYAEYARLAPLAKHTIDAYTIGIAYSDELVAVQRSAIKRGVRIRHVIQQLKPSNFYVAHAWQRLGVHLRLSRAERGFHLMIFDDTSAIVTFSDPSNTDDRISLVIETSAAVQVFVGYFSAVWLAAHEVDV